MVDRPAEERLSGEMPVRVLVVEDEQNVAFVIALALRHHGYSVEVTHRGDEALDRLEAGFAPDLALIDVMLPDRSGFGICEQLRRGNNDLPIIFLTARDAPIDRVHGLRLGADDYVVKPFDTDELCARVDAVLRRVGTRSRRHRLVAGELVLDDTEKSVTRAGVALALSPTEYKLLRFLLRRPGSVVSRTEILNHLWETEFDGESSAVETHVSALRRKLGGDPQDVIETVRGFGYRVRSSRD